MFNQMKKVTVFSLAFGIFSISSFINAQTTTDVDLRDRVKEIKNNFNDSNNKNLLSDKHLEITKDEMAFSPFVLSLEDSIEHAVRENLVFQNNYDSLEVSSRGYDSSKAGLYDPSMQFSYDKRSRSSPKTISLPFDTSSKSDSYSVAYSQQLQNGIDSSISYSTSFSKALRSGVLQKENTSGVVVNFSKPINGHSDSFLRSRNSLQKLSIDQKKSYYSYLDQYQKLVFRVIRSYLDVVKNKRGIEVVQSVLKYQQELLSLTKIKYRLGVATKLDVLRVEVQVAQQEESIISSENSYKNSLENLLNILNYQNSSEDVSISYDSKFIKKSYDVKQLIENALSLRFDLQIENLSQEQSKLDLRLRERLLTNKISLNTSIQKAGNGIDYNTANKLDNKTWSIGLRYNIALGNRAKRESLMIQRVQTRTQLRKIKDLKNNIRLDVRNTVRSIQANQKRIEVLTKNLQRANENLRLAKLSYEKGIKSSIEVLDAQDDLLSVNNSYVNSLLALKTLEFDLQVKVGSLHIPKSVKENAKKWIKFN